MNITKEITDFIYSFFDGLDITFETYDAYFMDGLVSFICLEYHICTNDCTLDEINQLIKLIRDRYNNIIVVLVDRPIEDQYHTLRITLNR